MKKESPWFTLNELAIMGVFGALTFAAVFILGSAILLATGIPATGGLANMLVALFLVVCGAKIIDKFGATTIMLVITGILAIPTISFGAPGIQKVPQLFIVGLVIDLAIMLFRRENKGYLVGGALGGLIAPGMIFLSMVLIGLPGADKLQPLLIPLSAIYCILGLIGAYLGIITYDRKLSKLSVVRNLKSK